ncbi:hypothetical protein SD960_20075 [Flavobacterium sp. MMLR14_040]|uniref:hypothetical protein n=1 Tax=Flavobacterium sp. MMLR14_040 TaxID=3093843 RepID=UPI00298F728D|nr:hypothetical protein [Flavobacterium sp. MMLR14_040]MDW8852410.1 hypothetical protein [Flavobacterium sp. MMLR14_040]
MSLDKTIRENSNGKYITIHADYFKEGIDYATQIKISQIHLIGVSGIKDIVDFKELEKISEYLKVFSFISIVENVINLESIYSLINIEKLYFQHKQKFKIDISRFPKIVHLGGEYWKGLINFNKAYSLQSLVLLKLPNINLKELSELDKLQILHVYSSKIQNLNGIEKLPIKKLSLVRNSALENIKALKELETLKELLIEKCKNFTDYDFLDSLKDRVDIKIIK